MFLAKWTLKIEDYIQLTKGTPEGEHDLIWSLFNNHQGNRPWQYKIESIKDGLVIWIRSRIKFEKEPIYGTFIFKEVGIPTSEWYQVKVSLNPIVEKREDKKNSVRIPLIHEEQINAFVRRIFTRHGFEIKSFSASKPIKTISNRKITFTKSEVVGIVKVVDQQKFINAVENGIGKEKSYGCGMLCLIPINEPESDNE